MKANFQWYINIALCDVFAFLKYIDLEYIMETTRQLVCQNRGLTSLRPTGIYLEAAFTINGGIFPVR